MPNTALSTAALGMSAQQKTVDNIANNLANVNTTGFKRSRIAFQDLFYQNVAASKRGTNQNNGRSSGPQLQIGHGSKAVSSVRNFSEGSLKQTGRSLDLAINGKGFFQVVMPDGSKAYTRDGNLTMNANGTLVTQSGLPLASRISIPQNAVSVNISEQGVVSAKMPGNQGKVTLGQLQMAKFVNPTGLSAVGDNLYRKTDSSGQPQFGTAGMNGFGSLQQGFLEKSNVNIVTEMVDMIKAQRAYQTNSKMVKTADNMMAMTNSIKR
ncbi:MAG TPA: flagellar basal-body rod protein FlgG [Balneolaceae bacterium]|nr:flagellar basal-body rod protein FlgG [Balneolaceae bacterium]